MIDNRKKAPPETAKRKPWMKWYPSDWRGEPTLRLVSRAARSVWIDLLGLMHDSTLIGSLLLNGRIPSLQDLAKVLGDDPQKLAEWMDELQEAGVFSVDEDGTIFSRKMRHAAEISEKGRKDIQKRGGAWAPGKKPPSPKKNTNRDPNRGANRDPTPQRLDTRTKEEELEPTLSSNPQTHNSEAIASEPSGSAPVQIELIVPKVAQPPTPLDFKKQLFDSGVPLLMQANGGDEKTARSMLGMWRSKFGDVEVLNALASAQGNAVTEIIPYVQKVLRGKSNGRSNGQYGRGRKISDHPRGIFGELGDELVEVPGGDWSPDHAQAIN